MTVTFKSKVTIKGGVSISSAPAGPQIPQPISYFKFDGNNAADETSISAAVFGGTAYAIPPTPPPSGNTSSLFKETGKPVLNYADGTDISRDITFCCWAYFDEASSPSYLDMIGQLDTINNGRGRAMTYRSDNSFIVATTTTPTSTTRGGVIGGFTNAAWHFVAFRQNATTVSVRLNSTTQNDTPADAMRTFFNSISIGWMPVSLGSLSGSITFINSYVSDFRVYDSYLSDEELDLLQQEFD